MKYFNTAIMECLYLLIHLLGTIHAHTPEFHILCKFSPEVCICINETRKRYARV